MTWVVGAAAILGYSVGISDIRVTFADGSEKDCLQKIYPVSRFIAVGFAGSVRVGFSMLDVLAYLLRDLPEGAAWIPQEVADCFQAPAKDVFQNSPPNEQTLHSHLMVLGAHPTEDIGIPGYGRCSVHILKSPDFAPVAVPIGEVVSIGSGSSIEEYREVLAGFTSDMMSLIKMETAGPGMGSFPLTFAVQKTVERNPARGISPHSHICIVRRGSVQLGTNDKNRYPQSGEKIEFRMPPVVTTWSEFMRISSADGQSPHCA